MSYESGEHCASMKFVRIEAGHVSFGESICSNLTKGVRNVNFNFINTDAGFTNPLERRPGRHHRRDSIWDHDGHDGNDAYDRHAGSSGERLCGCHRPRGDQRHHRRDLRLFCRALPADLGKCHSWRLGLRCHLVGIGCANPDASDPRHVREYFCYRADAMDELAGTYYLWRGLGAFLHVAFPPRNVEKASESGVGGAQVTSTWLPNGPPPARARKL